MYTGTILLLTKVTGKSDEKKTNTDAGKAYPAEDASWHTEHLDDHTLDSLRAEKIGHPLDDEGKTQGGEK
jgi:hypothetical protein